MSLKQTHTFSILEISQAAYEEIKSKLVEAGWRHAIMEEDSREVVDMHGIAVTAGVYRCSICGSSDPNVHVAGGGIPRHIGDDKSVDLKNVRQHCGHRAEELYRDDNNDIRCRICGQLR